MDIPIPYGAMDIGQPGFKLHDEKAVRSFLYAVIRFMPCFCRTTVLLTRIYAKFKPLSVVLPVGLGSRPRDSCFSIEFATPHANSLNAFPFFGVSSNTNQDIQ